MSVAARRWHLGAQEANHEHRADETDRRRYYEAIRRGRRSPAGEGARGWPRGLSDREIESRVCSHRAKSNKEIGQKLFISPSTVKRHLENIFDKTRVRTRAAAAVFAVDHELTTRRRSSDGGEG
jgi:DNA-binding NarL/FixJ family response regulator